MKGTPEQPQCGFSRAVVQILDVYQVPPEKLKTFNVLADPELRSGIKEYSCVVRVHSQAYCAQTLPKETGKLFHKSTLTGSLLVDVTSLWEVSGDILWCVDSAH